MPKQVSEQAKAVNNSAPGEGKKKTRSEGLQNRPTKNISHEGSSKKKESEKIQTK